MTLSGGESEILLAPTPDGWVQAAAARWRELLNDHAQCEKKAASTALALMFAYPEDRTLAAALSRLAREELRHFEQVQKLLTALDGETDRRAQYVCELVALSPDGSEIVGTGVLRGEVAGAAAGGEGFGFDPVFVPVGEERTVAQLGDAWKAEHSHRALAARALLDELGRRAQR